MNVDEYLKNRVDDQIDWYSAKSAWNQKRFKQFRVAELALASLIPVITVLQLDVNCMKIIVAGMGAFIAVIAGILSLFKFQENWVEYRAATEALKRERFMFLTGSGPYQGDDRLQALVARVENLLGAENEKWLQTQAAKAAGAAGSGTQPGA